MVLQVAMNGVGKNFMCVYVSICIEKTAEFQDTIQNCYSEILNRLTFKPIFLHVFIKYYF